MADKDDIREGKDFGLGIPQQNKAFYVKGAGALDWGMQNRLARIFNPASGRTVMLAFDHGYFQGPTTGLERIDLSILTELSRELIAVDIEDAIRVNAAALTTQIYVGAEYEHQSIKNLVQLIDTGNRYGIPTMAVTGVGAEMKRDERYFALATRIAAELGAHYVKSYFIEEGFERVCAGCPVPIVIAGGKKLPEIDALTMAYKAIDQGAAGVDMGRNIFQSDDPVAMIQAVGAVVHKNEKPEKAFRLYQQLKEEMRARNVPDRTRLARTS
jgi:putative autoinducer-2 (AI-2) aldolase